MNKVMKMLGAAALCMVLPTGVCLAAPHISTSRISMPATPQGEYVVYLKQDGKWIRQGEISCDRFFRTHELTLKPSSKAKALEIRIMQKGGEAAHLDSILINGKAPKAIARHGKFTLKKLATKDFDVIDAYHKTLDLSFDVAGSKAVKLALTGRVEGKRISKIPFQYPLANLFKPMSEGSQFYSYRLGSSKGKLRLDGDIARESLGTPLFREFYPSGSGHPSGTTYGWVRDDGKNLYVAMDFTADDTMDGNEDYAKVYVKTANSLKEYKVSMAEQAYGKPAFIYTDKVAYQHKTYEFAIPLSDLGLGKSSKNKPIQLAFAAYGTAAPGSYDVGAAYDPASNRYLVVYSTVGVAFNLDVYAQLVNGNGSLIGSAFPIAADPAVFEAGPSVAHDTGSGSYLVTWSSSSDIYAQLVNADGTLNGTSFAVTNDVYSQSSPSIAWDGVNGRYLVAWDDLRNGNIDIYGQLVNADGTFNGANFAMTSDVYSQTRSSIAWDGVNGRYLVAWGDTRNGNYDIYGQLVDANNGTLIGANFAMTTDLYTQFTPSVAWDAANSRYLVTWDDFRNGNSDIFGQLVNAVDSSLIGANFAISSAIGGQTEASVAWDAANSRYLVAWHDYRNGAADIYGQLVNADGTLDAAGNFAIAATANAELWADLAYNPVCGNMLAAYTLTDIATGAESLGLAVVGPPCPAAAVRSGGCIMIPTDSKAVWSIPILLLLLLGIVLVRRRS